MTEDDIAAYIETDDQIWAECRALFDKPSSIDWELADVPGVVTPKEAVPFRFRIDKLSSYNEAGESIIRAVIDKERYLLDIPLEVMDEFLYRL